MLKPLCVWLLEVVRVIVKWVASGIVATWYCVSAGTKVWKFTKSDSLVVKPCGPVQSTVTTVPLCVKPAALIFGMTQFPERTAASGVDMVNVEDVGLVMTRNKPDAAPPVVNTR